MSGSNEKAGSPNQPSGRTSNPAKPDEGGEEKATLPIPQLAVGLATLTAALTAVGGLTGGIARMFRNHEWGTITAFALVLGGVLFGIFAALPGKEHRKAALVLLSVGSVASVAGVMLAIGLMIDVNGRTDRPALSAQLAKDATGAWSVKGTAKTSGLKTTDKMSVFVYSLPMNSDVCNRGGVTAQSPVPSPTGPPSASPQTPGTSSPSPTRTASSSSPSGPSPLYACGQRLFYALTGPDQDGVATETFDVPLPTNADVSAFVLTANLGSEPRNCEGVAFKVQANPGDDSPPVAKSKAGSTPAAIPSSDPSALRLAALGFKKSRDPLDMEKEQTACLTFTSPPAPTSTPTPTPPGPTRHVVTLMGDVGFDRDSAALTPSGDATISRLARHLRGRKVVGTVTVNGYTDNLGTAAHGQRLSEQRAAVVARLLRAKLRFREYRIVSRGFGEHHPVASNATEAGRRQNRRVAIVFSLPPT